MRAALQHYGRGEEWGNYDYDSSYTDVHLDLSRHRKSLHRLHLSTKACGHDNSYEFEPVHSLADLEVLEYLEVDEDARWGIQAVKDRPLTSIFPTGLKRLIILGEEKNHNSEVWKEYAGMVLSEDHSNISNVEVRCTAIA